MLAIKLARSDCEELAVPGLDLDELGREWSDENLLKYPDRWCLRGGDWSSAIVSSFSSRSCGSICVCGEKSGRGTETDEVVVGLECGRSPDDATLAIVAPRA